MTSPLRTLIRPAAALVALLGLLGGAAIASGSARATGTPRARGAQTSAPTGTGTPTPTPTPAPTPAPSPAAYAPTVPSTNVLYSEGQSGRFIMDGPWLFRFDNGNGLGSGFTTNPSTAGWNVVSVPNAWNVGENSVASFNGAVGWYRKDFVLPSAAAGLSWIVRFESVNYAAEIWLNGHAIGQHTGTFLPFELVLPARYLSRGGPNRLVVRVDSHHVRRLAAAELRSGDESAERRLVELRRDPARGLPARGQPGGLHERAGASGAALRVVRGARQLHRPAHELRRPRRRSST